MGHPDRLELTEDEAYARINSQMSTKDKVSRADFVINNSGSLDELYKQCDIVFNAVMAIVS